MWISKRNHVALKLCKLYAGIISLEMHTEYPKVRRNRQDKGAIPIQKQALMQNITAKKYVSHTPIWTNKLFRIGIMNI
jgi:hypothetical protein